LEEDEQHQSKIVNIDEIPSPKTISVNPTPILDETQHLEVEAMKVDTPAVEQEPQSQEEENLKEVQQERTETTLEVNRMALNSEATTQLQEIENQVNTTIDLFNKAAQLWTRLEEDP
jgi:hypothetical protein